MVKKSVFATFLFLTFFKSFGQTPLYCPDGLVVGPITFLIPTGSNYKMAVKGGIITERVKVATNGTTFWSDFVFEPNYKLRSLSEVEKFVKENKHLPEIPSTEEVRKNGIDLAETQALLLQKIEELTLYSIEQNKKMTKIIKEVNYLRKKVNSKK